MKFVATHRTNMAPAGNRRIRYHCHERPKVEMAVVGSEPVKSRWARFKDWVKGKWKLGPKT